MTDDSVERAGVRDERPAAVRVCAFIAERFPPAPQVVLMLVLFVAATLMSRVLVAPVPGEGPWVGIDWAKAGAGLLGSVLFILRLRLYDDVKDADTDRVENPTRPIPRGLVTVRELDVAAALLLVVEAAVVWTVGPLAFTCWAVAAAWSLLMRVEFLAPRWLEPRVALYAISHMVVMGLIYGALLAMGLEMRGDDVAVGDFLGDPLVLGAMLAATSIGIGFEWGRKFPRYHAAHGRAAWAWLVVWPVAGAALFTWLAADAYPGAGTYALAVVTALALASHVAVAARGTDPESEVVEALPGVAGLLTYLVLAVAGGLA